MRKSRADERGLLSLGACISVTIFIFLMLYMYSFFVVFEARNAIGHAVLATANSLSLDAYANNAEGKYDKLENSIKDFLNKIFELPSQATDFSDESKWYDDSTVTGADGSVSASADFSNAIKRRFLAYLGGGDSKRADEVLRRYHIQNGVEGLDFSGSRVEGKNLYLTVRYTIEYEFQVFGLEGVRMEQSACSKLWA